MYIHSFTKGWGGVPGCSPLQSENLMNTDYVDTTISKVLIQLRFNLNQPQKQADERHTRMLKTVINTYEYVDILFFSTF